jgi:hypothetical protein
MILKAVCLSHDASVVLAYSDSVGILLWRFDGNESLRLNLGQLPPLNDKIDDEPVFLNFVNAHHVLLVSGESALLLDVSTIIQRELDKCRSANADPMFIIRRISLPCRCVCMDIVESGFVMTGGDGSIFRIDHNGRVESSFRPIESGQIHSIKVVNETSYLVGTNSELLIVNPLNEPHITSSYKLPHGSFVRSISIDPRQNWFCAVISSHTYSSRLLVGSTMCLATVFESKESMFVTQCSFAETSSNGLCIIASGPTPQLLLLPLDLSSAIPRIQFDPTEDVSAVLSTQTSPKGDLVVMAGIGPSVVLLSTKSLSIVHRYTLD